LTPTFVDAGVLIAAACGVPEVSERALRFLDDPDRALVTSDFVRLEVMPKPWYHGFKDQVDFYEAFFRPPEKYQSLRDYWKMPSRKRADLV